MEDDCMAGGQNQPRQALFVLQEALIDVIKSTDPIVSKIGLVFPLPFPSSFFFDSFNGHTWNARRSL